MGKSTDGNTEMKQNPVVICDDLRRLPGVIEPQRIRAVKYLKATSEDHLLLFAEFFTLGILIVCIC